LNRVIPQIENKTKAIPDFHNNAYTVIKKTSLRTLGNSKSKTLKRLEGNQKVIVLESPLGDWWKVICNNKVGCVKKHLLQNRARA